MKRNSVTPFLPYCSLATADALENIFMPMTAFIGAFVEELFFTVVKTFRTFTGREAEETTL